MRRLFTSIFSSPESLLQVMSQQEIIEAVEDGTASLSIRMVTPRSTIKVKRCDRTSCAMLTR